MKQHFEKQLNEIVLADIRAQPYTSTFSIANLKNYPTHLYKYRNCHKTHNFTMIEDDYLWADKPANFCDPLDSLVNHQLRSELPAIQKWIFQHLGEILYYCIPPKGMSARKKGCTLQTYIDAQKQFSDSTGRYNAKRAKRVMLTETRKLHPIKQRELQKIYDTFESPEFEKKIQHSIQEHFCQLIHLLRERHLVCCLTQRKDNQKMWEDYADQYAGFVIEYDLSKASVQAEASEVLTHTFPVTYYKRLPKVPFLPFIENTFYRNLYNQDINLLDATKRLYKQLLIKKSEYRCEEEWRILASSHKIAFPLTSAVYMGYRITNEHEQRLASICFQKNIPLYKQEFNPFTGTMRFNPVIYENKSLV